MRTRITIVVAILLMSITSFAQNQYKYQFNGIVQYQNSPQKDAIIRVYHDGQLIENKNTLANGYFDVGLDFGKNYFVEFSKNGFNPQRIFINTEIPENQISGNIKSDFYSVNLTDLSQPANNEVAFLSISPNSGQLVDGQTQQFDDKIAKAELLANKIISDAKLFADSLINSAKIERKNILKSTANYQKQKDSIEQIKNNLEEVIRRNNLPQIDKPITTEDTLSVIKKLINKEKEDIERLKKELSDAEQNNDTAMIAQLISEIETIEQNMQMLERESGIYQKKIDMQNLQIQKQNMFIGLMIVIAVSIFALAIMFLAMFRNKRKLSKQLAQKNDLLNIQNKKIQEKATELKNANDIILINNKELQQQRDEIAEQHKHITSSVKYAETIQAAILPFEAEMSKLYQTMILFKPRDIVSGDFYWFAKINDNTSIVSVIDCTGHGVPGAFMSMIGYSLLNQIVKEEKIEDPTQILERLDESVRASLKQTHTQNTDGMDLALCKIEQNETQNTVHFCGAKRPLFVYKTENKEVETLKGNRRSIGGAIQVKKRVEFKVNTFTAQKNDAIYLTSDGYIDQGNERKKRLGSPRTIKIIKENAEKSPAEQKQIFETELRKHQKNAIQRDDITIVAIKL